LSLGRIEAFFGMVVTVVKLINGIAVPNHTFKAIIVRA